MTRKYLISTMFFAALAFAQDKALQPEGYTRQYFVCTQIADDIKDTDKMLIHKKDCAAAETWHQDLRLNVAYRELVQAMKADREQTIPLRNDERAWMARRDKECQPVDDGLLSMASAQSCVLKMTTDRAVYLEKKLRNKTGEGPREQVGNRP